MMRCAASGVGVVMAVCLLVAVNVVADSWEEVNGDTLPQARSGNTVTAVPLLDGTYAVYMFGGRNMDYMSLNDLWRWHQTSRLWEPVTVKGMAPPERDHHGAVGYNGKLYIGYGWGRTGTLGDIWSFDVQTGIWRQLQLPDAGPGPHAYTAWGDLGGGRVSILGGLDGSGDLMIDAWIMDLNQLENPKAQTGDVFQHIMSFRRAFYSAVSFAVNGRPGVALGYGSSKPPANDLLVWNPEPEPWGVWEQVTPTGEEPLARALPGFATIPIPMDGDKTAGWGDMVIIFGGESSDKARASQEVQLYDSVANIWSYGEPMPMALSDLGAAVLPAEGDTYQVVTFGGVNTNGDVIPWTFVYTSDVPTSGCTSSATTLCLNDSRFQVEVAWEDFEGRTGVGNAVRLTSDTGYFWYFDDANVEMVIKVLDGRWLNDHYWVFYASLSNVQFEVTLTDTETELTKTYANPLGNFASVGDVEAFPDTGKALNEAVTVPGAIDLGTAALYSELQALDLRAVPAAAPQGDCTPTGTALCLNQGRFQVEVAWEDFDGNTGVGQAVSMTSDTGYFWFFDDANVELVLKVLDGRWLNNHYWVFYGALSNVPYEITVTDTATGEVKTYTNPSGTFASVGDTGAFEGT